MGNNYNFTEAAMQGGRKIQSKGARGKPQVPFHELITNVCKVKLRQFVREQQ